MLPCGIIADLDHGAGACPSLRELNLKIYCSFNFLKKYSGFKIFCTNIPSVAHVKMTSQPVSHSKSARSRGLAQTISAIAQANSETFLTNLIILIRDFN